MSVTPFEVATQGYLSGVGVDNTYTFCVGTDGYLCVAFTTPPVEPPSIIPGSRIPRFEDPTLYFEFDELERLKQEDEEILIIIKAFLKSL